MNLQNIIQNNNPYKLTCIIDNTQNTNTATKLYQQATKQQKLRNIDHQYLQKYATNTEIKKQAKQYLNKHDTTTQY